MAKEGKRVESQMNISMDEIYDLEMNVTGNLQGDAKEQSIKDLIEKHDVLVFSKTTCAYCIEMKRTLSSFGVTFAVFEANESGDFNAVKRSLFKITGCPTFPQLFVKGEFKGGCEKMKALQYTGELEALLSPFIGKHQIKYPEVKRFGIFWVPEIANRYTIRVGGTLAFIYCILCAGFYNRDSTPYAVLALAIDYTLRLIWGNSVSMIGMVATAFTARLTPRYVAGPPKQFATFACVFLSVWSAGLYLSGYRTGGAVLIVLLAAAVGMEGLLDWCLGCFVFGYLVRFGLVSKALYTPYLNFVENRKWAWDYTFAQDDQPVALAEHMLQPWQTEPTNVDLVRKVRLDTEYKLRDFSPIRHCRIEMFAAPMAVIALSFAYKVGGNKRTNFDTSLTFQSLEVISVLMMLPLLALFSIRAIMYPKKPLKEWQHPIFGNFYGCISIYTTMLGVCYLSNNRLGGQILIWIGSIMQMMITVIRVSELVYDRVPEDLFNPSMMIVPVGNFVSAIAFPYIKIGGYNINRGEMNFVQLGRLWFGIAVLYAITLFIITFRKAILDHHSDNRLRPLLWVWLATSSIAGPAYIFVSGNLYEGKGVLFQSLWSISLLFFVVGGIGWIRNFFTYVQDMSIWVMPFAMSAFAANTALYLTFNPSHLFEALSFIIYTCASATTAVCGLHTLNWIIDMSLFKPRPKWGPVNFLKITHEAFRFAVPKYQTILSGLVPTNQYAVDMFLAKFETLLSMFMEHARHEDEILYPHIRRYFPQMCQSIDEDHEIGHKLTHDIDHLMKEYRAGKIAVEPFLAELKSLYPKWSELLLPHLRHEEETLTIAARKYLPIELSMDIIRRSYEITPIEEWRRIMPFVIDNLPMPMWKTRYIKCLLWALPHRAHEIGLTLYLGCDTTTWAFFAQEMPELIPRGLPGHKRIY